MDRVIASKQILGKDRLGHLEREGSGMPDNLSATAILQNLNPVYSIG